MNLQKLRDIQFEDKFLHLLETVKYRFAQDQDYFNRICKGNIKYLKEYWNVETIWQNKIEQWCSIVANLNSSLGFDVCYDLLRAIML